MPPQQDDIIVFGQDAAGLHSSGHVAIVKHVNLLSSAASASGDVDIVEQNWAVGTGEATLKITQLADGTYDVRRYLNSGKESSLPILGWLRVPSAASILTLNIERVSDTTGTLTGSGSLGDIPPAGNAHIISLDNPFTKPPPNDQNSSVLGQSTLQANSQYLPGGSAPFDLANDAGSSFNIFNNGDPGMYVGSTQAGALPPHATISGSMRLLLSGGETFAPVGSSGNVTWGLGPSGVVVGRWRIVPTSDTVTFVAAGTALEPFDPQGILPQFLSQPYGYGTPVTARISFDKTAPDRVTTDAPANYYGDYALKSVVVKVGANQPVTLAPDAAQPLGTYAINVVSGISPSPYGQSQFLVYAVNYTCVGCAGNPAFQLTLARGPAGYYTADALPSTPPDITQFPDKTFRLGFCTDTVAQTCGSVIVDSNLTSLTVAEAPAQF